MRKCSCLEISGPGDYFGDNDYRGMAYGGRWLAEIDHEGYLVLTTNDYDPGDSGEGFDMEEYENHIVTLCAKPSRENWTMLHQIARTVDRYGSAKLWRGNLFLGEVRCDGSFHEFS